ncbi:zinc finger Ran-binding domain-containing protein 2-like [Chenopodium quinoa]|uniref:zinc finger Ran-binding domain-containing protein 2-like n=1 Tax=Chenopodium quinoa TaxID=63459 RepID=UPI000B785247|nr:zinc finger Ran-binding domain-containing protein 2-like [Chenopodium quinoa]
MSWGGDWMCGACQYINFKKREICQSCGFSKYGGQDDASAYGHNTATNRTQVLAGDWYCQSMNCGAHNYASRTSCYRCGAQKPECARGCCGASNVMSSGAGYGSEATPPGWKSGDWICTGPGCGMHNYACRMECFSCKTPRNFGGMY